MIIEIVYLIICNLIRSRFIATKRLENLKEMQQSRMKILIVEGQQSNGSTVKKNLVEN